MESHVGPGLNGTRVRGERERGGAEVWTQAGEQRSEMWQAFKFTVVEMNHLSQHSWVSVSPSFWFGLTPNTERLNSLIHAHRHTQTNTQTLTDTHAHFGLPQWSDCIPICASPMCLRPVGMEEQTFEAGSTLRHVVL